MAKIKGSGELKGTNKADKIYCEDAGAIVTGGFGNDKIYAGSGNDIFKVAYSIPAGKDKWGDTIYKGWDFDTIYNATSKDKIQFTDSSVSDFEYIKSGNNLLINAYSTNNKGKRVNSDRITLVNYFKADKGKSINDKDRLVTIVDKSKKNYSLKDDIAVTVKLSKSGTQYLGKGKYNILLNNNKKSSIVIDKTSDVDIKLGFSDTYNPKTKIATIKHQEPTDGGAIRKGNDLIFSYQNITEIYNDKNGKHSQKASTSTLTIKDYFTQTYKTDSQGNNIVDNGKSVVNLSSSGKVTVNEGTLDITDINGYVNTVSAYKKEGGYNYFDGLSSYNNKITGTKKNDRIYAYNSGKNIIDSGKGNDIIHTESGGNQTVIFYSGGYDNCITGSKNDTYFVGETLNKNVGFTKSSKLHIRDNGGSDTMQISAKASDLRLLFNVNNKGEIVTSQNFNFSKNDPDVKNNNAKYWDSLMIFNKSALTAKNIQKNNFTGVVEIDNWFGVGSSTSSNVNYNAKGSGYIEKISTKDINNGININSWINSVKEDVVKWLKDNNKASVADVLNGSDKNAINSLVKVFAGNTYNQG